MRGDGGTQVLRAIRLGDVRGLDTDVSCELGWCRGDSLDGAHLVCWVIGGRGLGCCHGGKDGVLGSDGVGVVELGLASTKGAFTSSGNTTGAVDAHDLALRIAGSEAPLSQKIHARAFLVFDWVTGRSPVGAAIKCSVSKLQ